MSVSRRTGETSGLLVSDPALLAAETSDSPFVPSNFPSNPAFSGISRLQYALCFSFAVSRLRSAHHIFVIADRGHPDARVESANCWIDAFRNSLVAEKEY